MPSPLSFDRDPDRLSQETVSLADQPLLEIRDSLKEDPELFSKYFEPYLWGRDLEVCRFHYLYGLTQDQVANLLGTTQPAIHSLLQSITIRLRFGIRLHQLIGKNKDRVGINITIREELEALMPPDLNLAAFFYCVAIQQDRISKLTRVALVGFRGVDMQESGWWFRRASDVMKAAG